MKMTFLAESLADKVPLSPCQDIMPLYQNHQLHVPLLAASIKAVLLLKELRPYKLAPTSLT